MTRVRAVLPGLTAAALLAGCNLLLTDWKTSEGGAPPQGTEPAVPLQATVSADEAAVFREGFFRIEADAVSHWQWARWFFFPDDATAQNPFAPHDHRDTAYYRTTCLWTAFRARVGDDFAPRSCEYRSDEEIVETLGAPGLDVDALPVAFTVDASIDAGNQVVVDITSRVFASGRVWASTRVANDYPAELTGVDVCFGEISIATPAFEKPSGAEEGLLRMVGGDGAVLAVDVGALEVGAPGGTDGVVWDVGDGFFEEDAGGVWCREEDLGNGDEREFLIAFHLGTKGPLSAERSARIADLRAPELQVASGATAPHVDSGGVDRRTGTYALERGAAGEPVVFALGDAVARFEPAFEIGGWRSETFVVRLGDRVLASNEGSGPDALAVLAGQKVTFQYLGVIAAGTPLAERTFTVSDE